jgi:hypothetical protein
MRLAGSCSLVLLCWILSLNVLADDYASLLARVKAGDFTVDFHALRFAYAQSPAYRPTSGASREFRQRVQAALERKDYVNAANTAEAWLAEEYVNPFAHLGAARAREALGATEQARFHNRVADALYESVCQPGQGSTVDAPCQVISLDEELFYLARHQFEVGGQYEETCARARPCHVYEVREPNSELLHDLHFDVSLPFAYQQAQAAKPAATTPGQPR